MAVSFGSSPGQQTEQGSGNDSAMSQSQPSMQELLVQEDDFPGPGSFREPAGRSLIAGGVVGVGNHGAFLKV